MFYFLGEKPYNCDQCNFATKQHSTLKAHIYRMHERPKPPKKQFPCKHCESSFTFIENLRRHMRQNCPKTKHKMNPGKRIRAKYKNRMVRKLPKTSKLPKEVLVDKKVKKVKKSKTVKKVKFPRKAKIVEESESAKQGKIVKIMLPRVNVRRLNISETSRCRIDARPEVQNSEQEAGVTENVGLNFNIIKEEPFFAEGAEHNAESYTPVVDTSGFSHLYKPKPTARKRTAQTTVGEAEVGKKKVGRPKGSRNKQNNVPVPHGPNTKEKETKESSKETLAPKSLTGEEINRIKDIPTVPSVKKKAGRPPGSKNKNPKPRGPRGPYKKKHKLDIKTNESINLNVDLIKEESFGVDLVPPSESVVDTKAISGQISTSHNEQTQPKQDRTWPMETETIMNDQPQFETMAELIGPAIGTNSETNVFHNASDLVTTGLNEKHRSEHNKGFLTPVAFIDNEITNSTEMELANSTHRDTNGSHNANSSSNEHIVTCQIQGAPSKLPTGETYSLALDHSTNLITTVLNEESGPEHNEEFLAPVTFTDNEVTNSTQMELANSNSNDHIVNEIIRSPTGEKYSLALDHSTNSVALRIEGDENSGFDIPGLAGDAVLKIKLEDLE